MKEQDARKLAAARLRALSRYPYWANIMHGLIPVPTTKIKTLAVDQHWRLYYNPDYVEATSVEELAAGLVHECGHILREHHRRCREGCLDPDHYNTAGDVAINDDIPAESDLRLPGNVLFPATFGLPTGQTEDWYYTRIPPQPKQSGGGKGGLGSGSCGSCATGRPEPYESPAPGQPGSVRGVSENEAARFRRATASDILDYESQHPGSVPGGLLRDVREVLQPRVPWRQELAAQIRSAIMQAAGRADYSFRRPNRRIPTLPDGTIMPGRIDQRCEVVVIVDTSGSMTKEMLEQVLGEAEGILRALDNRCAVRVLATDAAVHTTQRVMSARQIQLFGGGGTDLAVGIEAAQKLNPRADLIVCITDGYTDWPQTCPGKVPVTVVLVSESGEGPSWAKNIRATPHRQSMKVA